MTTGAIGASPLQGGPRQDPQVRVSVLSGLGCAVVGAVAALAGGFASGAGAAYGALIGAGLALGIFVTGALAVYVATRVLPSLALVVALLTYTCQVLVALMVFAALTRARWLDDGTVSGPWLGCVLALCTLLWVTVQIHVARTTRVPLYDLPDGDAR